MPTALHSIYATAVGLHVTSRMSVLELYESLTTFEVKPFLFVVVYFYVYF